MQRLPGEVELFSSLYSPQRDYLELITVFGGCTTMTTPMRVGSVWTPDLSARVVGGSGCATEADDPDKRWVRELFDHDLVVTVVSSNTVRFSSADGSFVELTWK